LAEKSVFRFLFEDFVKRAIDGVGRRRGRRRRSGRRRRRRR
jgi:hypothetical protein